MSTERHRGVPPEQIEEDRASFGKSKSSQSGKPRRGLGYLTWRLMGLPTCLYDEMQEILGQMVAARIGKIPDQEEIEEIKQRSYKWRLRIYEEILLRD